jgi:hypothetical protein
VVKVGFTILNDFNFLQIFHHPILLAEIKPDLFTGKFKEDMITV